MPLLLDPAVSTRPSTNSKTEPSLDASKPWAFAPDVLTLVSIDCRLDPIEASSPCEPSPCVATTESFKVRTFPATPLDTAPLAAAPRVVSATSRRCSSLYAVDPYAAAPFACAPVVSIVPPLIRSLEPPSAFRPSPFCPELRIFAWWSSMYAPFEAVATAAPKGVGCVGVVALPWVDRSAPSTIILDPMPVTHNARLRSPWAATLPPAMLTLEPPLA